MSEPELNPQEPGVNLAVNDSKLQAIADGNVGDFVDALDELGDEELDQLHAIEMQGKARSTALGAISREQQRRNVSLASPANDEVTEKSQLGDAESYSKMFARDVDPRKLSRPVLTRDGWVLPHPSAIPKE